MFGRIFLKVTSKDEGGEDSPDYLLRVFDKNICNIKFIF